MSRLRRDSPPVSASPVGTLWDVWLGRAFGERAMLAASERRLEGLLRFARANSPFYRRAWSHLPEDVPKLRDVPVTAKAELMAKFDDWATDRRVTRASVRSFIDDRSRIGQRFLDRYIVWKSSGTTGEPGIYVQDEHALHVYDASLAAQLATADLAARCFAGTMLQGGRAALIAATGDHFASIASWQRLARSNARAYSVMEPLGALVAKLNAFKPAFIASYPTLLMLLAEERNARRLRIEPVLAWSGGEHLGERTHAELERALGCRVMNEYGASECLSIGYGCREHWLHVNADWAIVEPVDEDYAPTPPGERSHTLLITNLANRVQPIIRYDLGDSVLVHPGRCACGNPLPALRVDGRRDDVLILTDGKREFRVPPMALTTVFEESTGVHRFQILQRERDRLLLRVATAGDAERKRAFDVGSRALHDYLMEQGARSIRIDFDDVEPQVDERSGKLRQVVVDIVTTSARDT
ncbi:MAG TPA: phenylacetate--CoA ligase family protein [Casimicrobiaceae bacterium]|nr:phenylacetate--CoA ligase family protein [Casimicrobiaceae bacterium]